MPESSFPEYAQALRSVIDAVLESGQAMRAEVEVDGRSALRGYISGRVLFGDDSELHFREFVDLTQSEPRIMYA